MNPINDIFIFFSSHSGYILAIIITTIIVKLLCTPIYVIRFKNRKLKQIVEQKVKELSLNMEKKRIGKKQKRYLYDCVGMKNGFTMLVLFVLEMTVIIMLINSIRLVGACNVLWFNLKYKDFFLSIIYLITIIINETIYIKGLPKDHRSLQYILSSIMAVIIFYCSLSVKSAIVVYWVVSGVFNICFNQYMEKYISKKHIDFDNKVFSEIFMSIKNNNMKGC